TWRIILAQERNPLMLLRVLLVAATFWEEIYKKFLYIRISADGKVIIFRFFRKYVLDRDTIRSVRTNKLFSRGALPNEAIRIETADTKFIISELYMVNYKLFKKYLSLNFIQFSV